MINIINGPAETQVENGKYAILVRDNVATVNDYIIGPFFCVSPSQLITYDSQQELDDYIQQNNIIFNKIV